MPMESKVDLFVVDDDPKSLEFLVEIFKLEGYRPSTAASGREALQEIQVKEFAVALIDLRLGDMSGLEVMKGIKQHSASTECILLTGYASRESAIEAINLGAYSYIQKPYDMAQLLLTIQRAVEKRTTEKALQQSEEDLSHVLEPFFTTKPAELGSGLGLSMVYGFVQQSGGACHIESTLGEGTEVMLVLPKVLGEEELNGDQVVVQDEGGGGETILVVEDKARVRRVVELQLESLGYIVHSVDNVEMAQAVIQDENSTRAVRM